MKGHHSARRDCHSVPRLRITSLSRALTLDCKLANAGDGDRFAFLKGGLEESKNPVQQGGCLYLRDPCVLMNVPGNLRLSHRISLNLRLFSMLLQQILRGFLDEHVETQTFPRCEHANLCDEILVYSSTDLLPWTRRRWHNSGRLLNRL